MSRKEELLETFHEVEELDREQFLRVKETLTRIGIPSKKLVDGRPVLWQTCHVFHKRGRYYICHFKQLFILDGRTARTDFTEEDQDRLEYIVSLLEDWKLIKPVFETYKPKVQVAVIPFKDKDNWTLSAKYTLGAKKTYNERDTCDARPRDGQDAFEVVH